MTTPRVHLEVGLFGKAACGKRNVDVTKDLRAVTCRSCRATDGFKAWWLEQAGVVGNPDQA